MIESIEPKSEILDRISAIMTEYNEPCLVIVKDKDSGDYVAFCAVDDTVDAVLLSVSAERTIDKSMKELRRITTGAN